jgi:spore germination protein YaaH
MLLTIVALTVVPACAGPSSGSQVRRVIAWVIGGAPGLKSLRNNLDAIDVVSPAYWRVAFGPAGTRLEEWDPGNPVQRAEVREMAARARVPVVPLVACLDECARKISAILREAASREAHVRAILEAVRGEPVDGVFIDYEGITCSADDFNAFVDNLAKELRRRGLRLGVAATEPCGFTEDCRRPGYPFDLGHLARVTDYLAVMHYDYQVDGSAPVAPRGWVQKGLIRVRREVGDHRAKVFVGMPFYGRITQGLAPDTAVLWSEVQAGRLQGQPFRILRTRFDREMLSHVAQIQYGPKSLAGTLYYEDHVTVDERLGLVASEGFSGVAIWRLGDEDPCNWDMIRAWKRRQRGSCRPAAPVAAETKKRVLVWVIGGPSGIDGLRANLDAIDVISPAIWRVALEGTRTRLEEWDPKNPVDRAAVRALATERNVPVLPLVACTGECARSASALLGDPAWRDAHADALLDAVAKEAMGGIFLDYHGLAGSPAAFNAFVDRLARGLRVRNLHLGIAVPEPCGVSPICERPGYPFDLAYLAATADHLAVLHYDFAVDGSDAVAPREWLVRGLARVHREVGAARAKVYAGIPFYGRIAKSLSRETAVLWSEIDGGKIQGRRFRVLSRRFDSDKLSQVARIQYGRKRGALYYEDHQTVAARLAVIEKAGFSNIAVWRIGGEDPCNWDVIRGWKRGAKGNCRERGPIAAPRVKRVVAWLVGGASGLRSFRENLDVIDAVSPTAYRVEVDEAGGRVVEWDPGNPVDRAAIRDVTRGRKVSVLPLVACAGACGPRIGAILADPARREAHVQALLDAVQVYEAGGVFLDYQGFSGPAAVFTAFAERLALALRGRGLRLGIAVPEPCGYAAACGRPGYAFDLEALARVADYLAVMEYDYSIDGSDAVAPRDWLVRGLTRVRHEVGPHREKVFVGSPFYGRLTRGLTRDTAVLWSEVAQGVVQGQPLRVVSRRFDPAKLSQVASIQLGPGGAPGTLFYEDHQSLAARLEVIGSQGFSSIAIWRLGDEDPCNWEVIRAWKRGTPGQFTCPKR